MTSEASKRFQSGSEVFRTFIPDYNPSPRLDRDAEDVAKVILQDLHQNIERPKRATEGHRGAPPSTNQSRKQRRPKTKS